MSANFDFLRAHDAQLVRLGALAERYFKHDPSTCLIKLRQFGELLAQMAAAMAATPLNAIRAKLMLMSRSSHHGLEPPGPRGSYSYRQ